jgi:translation initiation factor IF-3
VRVIGVDGKQAGVLTLGEALTLARQHGVDLVEIAATANPPVCRLVDYGKFRYEQAKKDKESKKHQHATKVKEIQLSVKIDAHDLSVKVGHAIDFLCDDMKVKVALRFRGREMAHTELGFQVVERFLTEVAPFGRQDFEVKLAGRSLNVMISPLPRNKRAKNPRGTDGAPPESPDAPTPAPKPAPIKPLLPKPSISAPVPPEAKSGGFANNPFAELDIKPE